MGIRRMSIGLAGAGRPVAALLCLCLASGCTTAGVVIGAGATAGVVASQERGFETAIDDNKISLDINRLLIAEDPDLFRRVSTEVVEGRVLLAGVVDTPEARVTANRLAWQAAGVREVINEIDVARSEGFAGYAKDNWITTKLRSRILTDTGITALNYSIETVGGTIYLLGIAQDRAELDRVIAHARDVSGVRDVVSYVQLKDDPARLELPGQASREAGPRG